MCNLSEAIYGRGVEQGMAQEIHDFSPDLVERLENGEDDLVTLMTDENTFSLYWE